MIKMSARRAIGTRWLAPRMEALEDRECPAIAFQIDYRFDSINFFTAPRRALLQAAADEIGNRLKDNLLAITPGGGNTWTADFSNPATGTNTTLANLTIPANTYMLFAGARDIPGTTIGVGGPGGFDVMGDNTFLDTVEARGQPGGLSTSNTDFGPWGGSLSFDSLHTWFFGTTFDSVAGAGLTDFFSVAQHEILHAIGFGTAPSFARFVQMNGTFTGPASQALFGAPVPLADSAHWQDGLMSGGQPLIMDPSISDSERISINPLDLAGLKDLGWDVGSTTQIQFKNATFSVSETGPTATITVSRVGSATGAVSVNFATNTTGTATPGSDFTATSGTLNWGNGDSADKMFTVAIANDTDVEGVETIGLVLSSPSNADLGTQATATLSITDNDSVSLQFSSATFSVGETGPNATITVDRTGGTSGAISVQFATTTSGSATAGTDFTSVSGTLNWAANETGSKTFTVPINNDTLHELNETVGLQLTSPTGGAILGAQATATLTIQDNDPVTLQFSSSTFSAGEAAGTATITVNRVGGSVGAVSVAFATDNTGTATAIDDFLPAMGTLNWADGDATPKTFSVTVVNDNLVEGSETIGLTLTNPAGDGSGAVAGGPAVLTIFDNDGAGNLHFSSATFTVNESGASATITVNRDNGSAGPASVQFATADGTANAGIDFTNATDTLNWADGETASKTFTVTITNDTSVELDETILLTLSNATGAALGSVNTATLTVTNDDLLPAVLQGMIDAPDRVFGARGAGSAARSLLFYNADPTAGQATVRLVNPGTGAQISQATFANNTSFSGASDRALVGDLVGSSVDSVVQFNRNDTSGQTPTGPAIRMVNPTDGTVLKTINYTDVALGGTQTYAQILAEMVDPEDEIFLGRFTQTTQLEALYFNRTNQNAGSTSIIVINLTTGVVADRGLHNNLNFGGFIDPTDEYTISDTNFDNLDDIVIVNRVVNPAPNRTTQLGFVGMVSLAANAGGRNGTNIGFYRFFDWNFAKPGENSVFPGFDELSDRATFGRVINNGPKAVIVLVNSQTDGNPNAAAYALLEPATLVQGVRDSFQLISTQFRSALPASSFDPDDLYLMTDTTGDGADEFVSFSRGSGKIVLRVFGAFTGATVNQIPTTGNGSDRPETVAPASDSVAAFGGAPFELSAAAVDQVWEEGSLRRHSSSAFFASDDSLLI